MSDESQRKPTGPGFTPGGGGWGATGFGWRYFLAILLGMLVVSMWSAHQQAERVQELSYTELKSRVRAGDVAEVTLRGPRASSRAATVSRNSLLRSFEIDSRPMVALARSAGGATRSRISAERSAVGSRIT